MLGDAGFELDAVSSPRWRLEAEGVLGSCSRDDLVFVGEDGGVENGCLIFLCSGNGGTVPALDLFVLSCTDGVAARLDNIVRASLAGLDC